MSERLSPSQSLLQYFSYSHLPEPLQSVSGAVAALAKLMELTLPDGPEKTAGMRKLLEGKDCFVRAMLEVGKPWWQTSDLTEVLREVKEEADGLSDKDRADLHSMMSREDSAILDKLFPAVDATPPEDLSAATIERKNRVETEQAKAKSVVDGKCFGPIIISTPDDNGMQTATCYFDICTWERPSFPEGTKSVMELQQAHNDAGMPLRES